MTQFLQQRMWKIYNFLVSVHLGLPLGKNLPWKRLRSFHFLV